MLEETLEEELSKKYKKAEEITKALLDDVFQKCEFKIHGNIDVYDGSVKAEENVTRAKLRERFIKIIEERL